MRTVRRLLFRDVVGSVVFTAVAFLALFFFIDFVDELDDAGRYQYAAWKAALAALLALPGHFYELFPIAVLIGAIYALARMAQSSEFTILRTGGLGPGRALSLLTMLGAVFSVLTFVVGDYVAPIAERQRALLRFEVRGGVEFGLAGRWMKDHRETPQGERNYSISVASASARGELESVRIFEFDTDGRLRSRTTAATANVDGDAVWHLKDVEVMRWPAELDAEARVDVTHVDELDWPSTLSRDVVAAAVLPIDTMSTLDLYRYSRHLEQNEQAGQRYEIQFWRKALYPFACLVMLALALPFAYLHTRSGGISLKVFGGIMLGVSFALLNSVSGHLGVLRDWSPWVAASLPSLAYLMISMAAFSWLVRYR